MIKIIEKCRCCGCSACVQVCPKQCIRFVEDEEGFLYPLVESQKCINCGLCESVCPIINQSEESRPISSFAVINEDLSVRINSSSGGVFSLLAEQFISHGGIVFGARFDDNWMVVTSRESTMAGIAFFRGSKYVQSNVSDCFSNCKEALDNGLEVLFSGTPCQIAGLRNYLRKDYPNLFTVDFICHGVPSPGIWRRYVTETCPAECEEITEISFRDKREGWRRFSFVMKYKANNRIRTISSTLFDNPFLRAFLSDLILRPSCYNCPTKSGRSHSDITLGDLWGVEHLAPSLDDDLGVSLVMVNTEKGFELYKRIKVKSELVKYEDACKCNTAIYCSSKPHNSRDLFFAHLRDNTKITRQLVRFTRPSLRQRLRISLKWFRGLFS